MEQKNGMMVGIFSLVIAVIIIMGVMAPMVSDWTTGERIENEGAGWLRMSYVSSPSYQTIAADLSGEGVVIYNDSDGTPGGTETLTGTEDTIIYADNNLALWYENDTLYLLGQIDGEPVFVQRNDAISLVRESDGIRVSAAETPTITFPFPAYAYEPNSEGNYAFFTNDTPVKTESGMPNAIVGGGFAGVYAYNNIFRYSGLGLGMEIEYDEDGKLVNVSWDKIMEEESTVTPEPLGAPYIRVAHEDDVDDIKPASSSESGGLRASAIPTPTYTDGDWGYDLVTDNGVQKAVIVSYSGAGGNIIVPATIGGYDVLRVGKSNLSDNLRYSILTNSNISSGSTLTISDGIKQIGGGAFSGANKITSLTLSNTLEWIGDEAFYGCTGLTGALVLPDTLKVIGYGVSNYGAFQGCTGLTSLTLNNGLEKLVNAFRGCTGLTGTLVIPDSVTSILAMSFYDTRFTGTLVIPDSVTTTTYSNFSYMSNITSIKIGSGITTINNGMFTFMSGYVGDFIPPATITAIGEDSNLNGSAMRQFGSTNGTGTLVIPETVNTIGNQAFRNSNFKAVVIASDDIPYDNDTFISTSKLTEVLDLSRNVDYSVDRHGIADSVTVSDSIGDCFGYISFTEIGSDPKLTGPIATLLTTIPLLMIVGLVIAAVGYVRMKN